MAKKKIAKVDPTIEYLHSAKETTKALGLLQKRSKVQREIVGQVYKATASTIRRICKQQGIIVSLEQSEMLAEYWLHSYPQMYTNE